MPYRKFLALTFLIFFLGISLFPMINLYVDSSRVLSRDYDYSYGSQSQANHVFLKVAWVIDNADKYHSFIFGSSRVDVGFATNDFPEGWFKVSQPGGHPKEHMHNLKALLANDVNIKEIWLTLDDFDIYQDRDLVNDYKLRPYPLTIKDKLDFLWFYLFRKPSSFERQALENEHALVKNHFIKGRIEKNGIPLQYDSYEAHEKKIKLLNAWSWDLSLKNKVDFKSTLSYVEQIKKLCEENGIKLEVMMTPRHYKILYARDYFNMAEFRRRLATVVPYWDFSALPSAYWQDNHYWLETSHFSTEVGKRMQVRVNGDTSVAEYDDQFGVFVTTENINEVVEKSYEVLLSELPIMLKYDPNIRIDKSYLNEVKEANVAIEMDGYSFSKPDIKGNVLLSLEFYATQPATLQWQCAGNVLATTDVVVDDEEAAVRNFYWEPACNESHKLVVSKKEVLKELTSTWYSIASPPLSYAKNYLR